MAGRSTAATANAAVRMGCVWGDPPTTETMATRRAGHQLPAPPALDQLPLVHASAEVAQWLTHYWNKLHIPAEAAERVAVTNDRLEFARWTGRRLNPLALGCYCYLPNASADPLDVHYGAGPELLNAESASTVAPASVSHLQPTLPGLGENANGATTMMASIGHAGEQDDRPAGDHRHLIFIEPDLLPVSTEVTVAHELIHLYDRVQGHPRRHRCHGYDSISVDEAALTEQDPAYLREQLREETARREAAMRHQRPYRYLYICPACHHKYPRVRRYSRPVSCGRCDRHYNRAFVLDLVNMPPGTVGELDEQANPEEAG